MPIKPKALKSRVREIPLKDFFKNPEKAGYSISPNGKYIAYLAPYNSRMNIFVQETGSDTSQRITGTEERDIFQYFWGNDRTILFLKDKAGDENFHLYSVSIDGKNEKDLTPFENVRCQIVDELDDSDTEILIELNKRVPEVFDVYKLKFETGEMEMIAENPGNISGWVTDHEGKIRIAVTTDGVNTSVLYREDEKNEFKTIITTSFKETLTPLFFTFDNRHLYASSNLGRDKSAIVKYDIASGRELEVIYENPDVDVANLNFSRKRKV
jgi:hypothetical protein